MKYMILGAAMLISGNAFASKIICKVNDTFLQSDTESLVIHEDLKIMTDIDFCYGCNIYTLKAVDSKGELISAAKALVAYDVGYRVNNDPAALNIMFKFNDDVMSCSTGIGKHGPVLF